MNNNNADSNDLAQWQNHDQISQLAMRSTLQALEPSSTALVSLPGFSSEANNNTILDQHKLSWPSNWPFSVTQDHLQRSQSALNNVDLAKSNGHNDGLAAHHPLLSPRHGENGGVNVLNPLKSLQPLLFSSMNKFDEPQQNLNDDETAQLLLKFSQNLSRPETASSLTNSSPSQTPSTSSRGQQKARTYFRAPGLEAPTAAEAAESGVLVCKFCGFSCTSKFHYNSHMNTHGTHECQVPSCNYTSRTEGRLKKHMTDSHTEEQRQAVGYVIVNKTKPDEQTTLSSALDEMKAMTEGQGSIDGSPLKAIASPPKRAKKLKKYPCKQCPHVSTSKEERYSHAKLHIPIEKQLNCPQCEFVTEYRHHLEYHTRNHMKSKPFKCTKCEYDCVNKSMLNSHMKSHMPAYQYKCLDCTYQTKYGHSLRMHLSKYNHRRAPANGDNSLGDDNSLVDDNFDGIETESMKNFDPSTENRESRDSPSNFDDPAMMSLPAPQPIQPRLDGNGLGSAGLDGQSALARLGASGLDTQSALARLGAARLDPNLFINQFNQQNNQQSSHSQLLNQLLMQPNRLHEMVMAAAANNLLRPLHCEECEFSSMNAEEMARHKRDHLVYNQKQNPLNLYQNLLTMPLQQNPLNLNLELLRRLQEQIANNQQSQQQIQQPIEVTEMPSPSEGESTQLKVSESAPPTLDTFSETHIDTSPSMECSVSPSNSHKSLDNVSSGASPNSSTTATTHSGSKQRKSLKIEEISQRLQGKCSPDNIHGTSSSPEREDTEPPSPYKKEPHLIENDEQSQHHHFTTLFHQMHNNNNQQPMPYTCAYCSMAFQDRALWQVHLGYHGYEHPLKCNRCGHDAPTPLDFNLHLYQSKH